MKKKLLDAASFTPLSLQPPDNWCGHMPFSSWLIRNIEPQIFVELGTHSGNSYFSFCQSVTEENIATKCYAVDTWKSEEHTGPYGEEVFHQVHSHNETHYANFSRLLRMTFDDALSYFSDGSVELLHIDGLHTYEAVKHDFETWLPKLAPGAVVLFHDTNVRERGFGVWKLWDELKTRYPNNLEFLHSNGLGFLQLDGATDAKKLGWPDAGSDEHQQLKVYFSALGARQSERLELSQMKIHVANLIADIAKRDGQLAEIEIHSANLIADIGQLAKLDDQLAEMKTHVANLIADIAKRDGQLAQRDGQLAAILNSTCWLITKPLRFSSNLLFGRKEIKESNEGVEVILNQGINTDLEHEPSLQIDFCASQGFNTDLETILVVSHEASRTGAPVLSLNLVQGFVERYNVVVLLLGEGPLSRSFLLPGVAVMESPVMRDKPALASHLINKLCKRFNFKFALVNSIESRVVLPALAVNSVAGICLIHEFASVYACPKDIFEEVLSWPGELVFSTNLVLENAIEKCPAFDYRSTHIIPQGRCILPLDGLTEDQLQLERERIRRLVRPKDSADNLVVVLGVGSVALRKGVDLFIQCAARVVRSPGGEKCRFVWIGKGYDPDNIHKYPNDHGYSMWLSDQIIRSGLEEHVFFVDETAVIESGYEEADLFLVTSRLDPLPNVAIDSMAHGVPVLCFNKATGIADFLIDSDLGNYCVAEYLDSADMADKVLALVESKVLREQVGNLCRESSTAYFNMGKYVARLEALAISDSDRIRQARQDKQQILDSGSFRLDFSLPPLHQVQSIEKQVQAYARAWASGIDRRKPFPGFNPGIYQEQHGLVTQGADPLADYLREGQPDGPWSYPVILADETNADTLPSNNCIALHVHVYYPEMLREIISKLLCNQIRPDLFISVVNEEARKLVISELKRYEGNIVDIQIVPNRGRDIGPLLTAFGQKIVANYNFVGHIHTKKTDWHHVDGFGRSWYLFLLENLLGGKSGVMADTILARMNADSSIGMVFPDDPNIVGWGGPNVVGRTANRVIAESFQSQLGVGKLPEHFTFPVGNMFWARTSALAPFINLEFDWDDYPEEPVPIDGTLLHAIERMLPLSLAANDLRFATTNVIGLTR